MTDLADLIARVEGATGPDRDIDRWLHLLLVNQGNTGHFKSPEAWLAACRVRRWNTEHFTRSIDAASHLITLTMGPTASWGVRTAMEGGYAADIPFVKLKDMWPSPVCHRTAPLAIILALLHSLQAGAQN